jgi:hypothetical protein
MPGTGPLRRSSGPARKKAIVDKSRVEANRLGAQRLSFLALIITGFMFLHTQIFRYPSVRGWVFLAERHPI